MNRYFLSLAFIILFLSTIIFQISYSSTTEFAISARIGSEIDKNERDYFNLFPKINNFISAKTLIDEKGEKKIIIEYDSSNIKMKQELAFSQEMLTNIKNAIEKYEYLYSKIMTADKIEVNWDLIPTSIMFPSYRYNEENDKYFKFKTISGNVISGKLLWADSLFIILSPENYRYGWVNVDSVSTIIHFSEIDEIIDPKNIKMMGNNNIYNINLEYFKEISSFSSEIGKKSIPPPPEIMMLLFKNKTKFKEFPAMQQEVIGALIEKFEKDYHFTLDISPFLYLQVANNFELDKKTVYWYVDNEGIGRWVTSISHLDNFNNSAMKNWSPGISFEYNLTRKIRLGFIYNYYNTGTADVNTTAINSKGYSYGLFVSYLQKHHNPFSYNFWDKVDVSYSIGYIYGKLDNELQIYIYELYDSKYRRPYKYKHTLSGIVTTLKLDYYFSEYLSLSGKFYINILLPQEFKYWEDYTNANAAIVIQGRDINYYGAGLRIGLGLHL